VERENDISMQIVFLYLAQACKRCRTLGSMFLKAKGLGDIRVNSFISLVADTRLGLALYPVSNSEEITRNCYELCIFR
jgi:hypothetical protein